MGIPVSLERRIRAGEQVNRELIELMDRAVADARSRQKSGMGYQEILAVAREVLGRRLAVPQNPSTAWIIKQVSRARELGLDAEQLRATCETASRAYRGYIELEFILRAATRIGAAAGGTSEADSGAGTNPAPTLHTGRRDFDE